MIHPASDPGLLGGQLVPFDCCELEMGGELPEACGEIGGGAANGGFAVCPAHAAPSATPPSTAPTIAGVALPRFMAEQFSVPIGMVGSLWEPKRNVKDRCVGPEHYPVRHEGAHM